MRALIVAEPGQAPSVRERPVPRPGPGELLVRVAAAGVIVTELAWQPTTHRRTGEVRTDAVPGHEFSGVVAAVGEGVAGIDIGAEVYGMNDWYADGAMADYCTAPYLSVAPKPAMLSDDEAASVPISALTAWQGLFERAAMQAGDSVLVHGGAGAVGTWAIQLARLRGAKVIATASAENAEFVTELGAHAVIDYRTASFEDSVGEVDVVFDTVGGDTLARSFSILKPHGRIVTIVSSSAGSADPRVKAAFFIVEAKREQLSGIGALLDEGRIRTVVDSVVPLAQAPDVYAGKQRHGRGKVVVSMAAAV
jgi:NADPH:quinone reductase-like Zn-dependent oxidoreductase